MILKRLSLIAVLLLSSTIVVNAQEGRGGEHREGRPGEGRMMNVETGSALTVFSESGDRFYLILNGVKQNSAAQNRVRIEALPQVENEIQIIFDDNATPEISRRISFADPVDGRAVNLTLKIVRERDGRAKLVFFKLTPLEHEYRGEQGEYIMRYGHDEQRILSGGNTTVIVQPAPTPPAPAAMDAASFADAKQAIAGNSFDDGKLSTAKTIANTNYFTTDQVIEICQLFSFDDSKLAFAEYAFKRTVDNNSYFKVNSAFSFDATKTKLNDYVNKNR